MSYYKVSALAFGFVLAWRGWRVFIPVVIADAVLQALLIWPDPTPAFNVMAILLALLSALVFLAAYALVVATALHVPDGRVGWRLAANVVRQHAGRYVINAVILGIVVAIGLALYTVPGLLVIALTPFVLMAVLDGRGNPVAANFTTIGRRFWRWLVMIVITGLVLLIGWLLAGLFAFFMRGLLASFVVWLVAGLIVAWFTTAWALIYRSAQGRQT